MNLLNPCKELCFLRFGKQYTEECDSTCEFAKAIKENKELKAQLEAKVWADVEERAAEEYNRGRNKDYV